jgi:hypothetical protein
LAHHFVDLRQRHHVFALETLPRPHAPLVLPPQAQLAQVLDQRDENIFRIVLLKGEMAVDVSLQGGGCPLELQIRNLFIDLHALLLFPSFLRLLHVVT